MDVTNRAVGFSDVGYDEAMRRARELIPFLREQAPKCEEARRLTPCSASCAMRAPPLGISTSARTRNCLPGDC